MNENTFMGMIMLALLFSVIGMFYCIYVDRVTHFLIFGMFFTSICLFSILYSEIKRLGEKIK